jgi:hypothetical protein
MSDYFAFRFYEPGDESRRSLVIFFSSKISLDDIAKSLKSDVAENLVPKNVYLISFERFSIARSVCLNDGSFTGEFNSYVGEIDERLKCLSVDQSGGVYFCGEGRVPDELSNAILHSGMIALFKRHSGLVVSNHGYHFIKPSGDHCDKFIRASNLLVSGVEVNFLAVSLLPYLRSDLKRIYVDTSSISFLISIAVQQFNKFDDGIPSIESFESYSALKEPFDFVEDGSSLIFVSATTSGSLVRDLLSTSTFSRDQIVTLFHINLPGDQRGVFDVEKAIDGGLVSRKASECQFCKRGSKLIRIAGDQFLPENPKHELLVIKKDHFEKDRQTFFRQFAATGVLGWNTAASPAEDAKEHFFLAVDTALILGTKPFSDSLQKRIRRHVSRDMATVIVFDDAGSRALEEKIRDYLGDDAKVITWLRPDELNETKLANSGSVLVLVGVITSGRSLLAVSRKLRCINPLSTITYFVAFSKLPNEDAFRQLERDLKQGGHDLVVLTRCSLPRIKEYSKTAWHWEAELLRPLGEDDPLGDGGGSLPDVFIQRRNQLFADSNDPQKLFLPSSDGQPLKLRRTFAFWSDLGFDKSRLLKDNQADVYWTIQAVLHDLRNASENKGLATTYHTTLISPANFDRYNDGVIQACLLRAAHPVEMDYRVDAVFSRQMTDVISSVLKNWDNAQGEAALEFLMALWTRRLCIDDMHLRELVSLKRNEMTEGLKFMFDRISERFGDDA